MLLSKAETSLLDFASSSINIAVASEGSPLLIANLPGVGSCAIVVKSKSNSNDTPP